MRKLGKRYLHLASRFLGKILRILVCVFSFDLFYFIFLLKDVVLSTGNKKKTSFKKHAQSLLWKQHFTIFKICAKNAPV